MSLPSSHARNPRGENNSRRSRRCIVTAPLLSRHVRPRYCAVQRFFTRLLVVFGVTSIARWRNPLRTVLHLFSKHRVTKRIGPNPVSRCEESSTAVPVGNIGAIYVGYDHTARTGDACQVRSGPENCANEYRAMQPSWWRRKTSVVCIGVGSRLLPNAVAKARARPQRCSRLTSPMIRL